MAASPRGPRTREDPRNRFRNRTELHSSYSDTATIRLPPEKTRVTAAEIAPSYARLIRIRRPAGRPASPASAALPPPSRAPEAARRPARSGPASIAVIHRPLPDCPGTPRPASYGGLRGLAGKAGGPGCVGLRRAGRPSINFTSCAERCPDVHNAARRAGRGVAQLAPRTSWGGAGRATTGRVTTTIITLYSADY